MSGMVQDVTVSWGRRPILSVVLMASGDGETAKSWLLSLKHICVVYYWKKTDQIILFVIYLCCG